MTGGQQGRVALVTGANRGIGLEIARQLGARGYHLVVGSRTQDSGEKAAQQLRDVGYSSSAVALDVSDAGSITTGVSAAIRELGRIDVLVNNAGIAIDGPGHRPSHPRQETVRSTLETNLFGAWECARAVLPSMRSAGYGRIVNMSSNMASLTLTESDESPAYRISKAALNMLTVLLAAEVRAEGNPGQCGVTGLHAHGYEPQRNPQCGAGRGHAGVACHPSSGRSVRRLLLRKGPAAMVNAARLPEPAPRLG
jgi:NAD(P)-dependent dehydrogenase (short-subunit alcohol dehydrogenase family)